LRSDQPKPHLHISVVIAGLDPGLDPAIHLVSKKMDARVKPAHDEVWGCLSFGRGVLSMCRSAGVVLGMAAALLAVLGSNAAARADDRANMFVSSASGQIAVRHPVQISRRVHHSRYVPPPYYYPGPSGWNYYPNLRNHPYFDWGPHDYVGLRPTLPVGPPWASW
jgi:hypothetical protein